VINLGRVLLPFRADSVGGLELQHVEGVLHLQDLQGVVHYAVWRTRDAGV
jgi:hypothetical protein